MKEIEDTLRQLGVTWANEYGDYIKGAADDIAAFYSSIAGAAAASALAGDQDALRMLRLAGYSMLAAHRCELSRRNRATVQRGIRILVDVVGVVANALAGNLAGAVGTAVDRAVDRARS